MKRADASALFVSFNGDLRTLRATFENFVGIN